MLTTLTRRLLPLVLAIAAFTALVLPTAATGAPIDDKRAQAADLEAQINAAATKLGALNEQINDAQIDLDAANATIADADAKVEAAKARTNELKQIVADRAVSLYTRSGTDATVDDLDATRATDLTAQQKYASVAAQRDNDAMYQLKKSQEDLAVRKADAEQARGAAEAKKEQMQGVQAELSAGQQKLQTMKSGIDGEIADLVKQAEADRIARENAANAARLAQTAATTAAATTVVQSSNNNNSGGGGSSGGSSATPPPSSGSVSAVMAYAYAQLGKPYCYAGVGPDCYDCSGLTMMAWAQAGLSLPHGSYAQLAEFPSVSMSNLQVGDLVYWPDHVGIYVGGGAVLHAPHTGTVVQITTIWSGVIGANRPS
jgi:cell wall-associated NlpC family hydrolase